MTAKRTKPAKTKPSKYSTEVIWSLADSRGDEREDVSLDAANEADAMKAAQEQDYAYAVRTVALFYNDSDLVEILEQRFILRPDLAQPVAHPCVLVEDGKTVAVVR